MSDYYSLATEFELGQQYRFTYQGKTKDKIYIGTNEYGFDLFDHINEERRSFVNKNKILNGIKIEKLNDNTSNQ